MSQKHTAQLKAGPKSNNCNYPNSVIMPVRNNEHQMIDDISTDLISYGIVTRDNWFRIVAYELFDCFVQASQ